jgi:hypothetical protein
MHLADPVVEVLAVEKVQMKLAKVAAEVDQWEVPLMEVLEL